MGIENTDVLLRDIFDKLERIENRLSVLEADSHKQVTEETLRQRFAAYVPPSERRFC